VGENQDLFEQMMVTLCRLARDRADRGDVMLMHKAFTELRYSMKTFAPYAATPKVSIFGSSRTPEGHPDYQVAARFACRMRESGWMIITGAGDGIMKAGHGGAGAEASFGVAIRLPFEQRTNAVIDGDAKLMNFRYFFTRKLMFMKEASAVALFPGGFGTLDEGFEALTLIQTGKAPLIPIVMLERRGGTYWRQWRAHVETELLQSGMIGADDMHLLRITDDVEEAVQEILGFYRVYHSMRFVGEDLVLRLRRRISPETLARLNAEFGDLLASGRIEQCAALEDEHGEYADLPRLKLHFNRKSPGRLRTCIDAVNREPLSAGGPQESRKKPVSGRRRRKSLK
jgi:uncharacterized protein (TIGR00730 family)